jgi:hypothetical protein
LLCAPLLAACGEAFVALAPAPAGGGGSGATGAASSGGANSANSGSGASSAGSGAGGGSTSAGAGGAGGGTGAAALADRELLVRYWIDEAASGTAVSELIDAAATPLPMPISYGGNVSFTETGGHRALDYAQAGADGYAAVPIDGSKLAVLDGATQASMELVVQLTAATNLGTRILHIGDGSWSYFSLEANATNDIKVDWNNVDGDGIGTWPVDLAPLGRVVVHVVLDTDQAQPNDRIRFYLDGVLQIGNLAPPSLGDPTSLPAGLHLSLGNRPSGSRSMAGRLFYAALYRTALSDAEIAQNVAALLLSDDL